MFVSHIHLCLKALLAAAFVTVLEGAFAPATAEAACGDYVLIGGRSIRHSDSLPRVMHENQASPDPAAPCRCSGPACSNGDQHLPATPPTIGASLTTDWGLAVACSAPAAAESRFAGFDDDSRLPRLVAASIFHPPR